MVLGSNLSSASWHSEGDDFRLLLEVVLCSCVLYIDIIFSFSCIQSQTSNTYELLSAPLKTWQFDNSNNSWYILRWHWTFSLLFISKKEKHFSVSIAFHNVKGKLIFGVCWCKQEKFFFKCNILWKNSVIRLSWRIWNGNNNKSLQNILLLNMEITHYLLGPCSLIWIQYSECSYITICFDVFAYHSSLKAIVSSRCVDMYRDKI